MEKYNEHFVIGSEKSSIHCSSMCFIQILRFVYFSVIKTHAVKNGD